MSTAHTSSSKPPPLPTSPPIQSAPPRTPLSLGRSISSLNSPSLSSPNAFRIDDEVYIFHLSSTCLHAGFGGEQLPRSITRFSPNLQQRPASYDKYLQPRYEYLRDRKRVPKSEVDGGVEQWGREQELYRPNLMGLDIGLTEDTFERAIRQANTHDLLVLDESTRKRQLLFVVSSALPQPLLETFVDATFRMYPQPTTITLFSENIMCIVSAGLRSAMVIDIGWHETVISAICEYREVNIERSQRSGKRLSWEVAKLLQDALGGQDKQQGVAIEDVEEVVQRMCWCRKQSQPTPQDDDSIHISLPSFPPSKTLAIKFSALSEPAERTFFAASPPDDEQAATTPATNSRLPPTPPPDEHLTQLPLLIYQTYLKLPPDIRAQLFDRIVFTGGCSNLPGLKSRTLTEVANLIRTRGWSPVNSYGRNTSRYSGINVDIVGMDVTAASVNGDQERQPKLPSPTPPDSPTSLASGDTAVRHQTTSPPQDAAGIEDTPLPPPAQRLPEADAILAKLRRTSPTGITRHNPRQKITLRAIKTLGPWAGASLLSGLRVKGTVEIEREAFLQHGLSYAGGDGSSRRSLEHTEKDRAGVRTGSPEKKGRPSLAAPGKMGDTAEGKSSGLGPWA